MDTVLFSDVLGTVLEAEPLTDNFDFLEGLSNASDEAAEVFPIISIRVRCRLSGAAAAAAIFTDAVSTDTAAFAGLA